MKEKRLTHKCPKISMYQQERGSVLPLSIFMFTLASLASVYMITLTQNDRNKTVTMAQKTSAFYAMEGAAQHARVNIESFVQTRLSQAYKKEDWRITNAHFLDPSNASINHGVNVNNFFSTIPDVTGSLSSKKKDLGYDISYFYDKNLNGVQDSGEEGFVLVNSPPSGQGDQKYIYRYSATVTGKNEGVTRSAVLTGTIFFGLEQARFSKYGLFTNVHAMKSGNGTSPLWFIGDLIFDGPVHTNGEKNSMFHFSPLNSSNTKSATFNDDVTSVNKNITFAKAGAANPQATSPPLSDKTPQYNSSGYARPQYNTTYERDVAKVDLPPNNLSQARAALGGDILNTDPIDDAEIRDSLGLGSSDPITGVHVVKDGTNVKGGIYVKGDVDTVSLSVDGDKQIIDITQGTTSVTITQNFVDKQTIITSKTGTQPAVTTTLTGLLNGMLQVDGKISALGGPKRPETTITTGSGKSKKTETVLDPNPASAQAAIHKNNKMTISASGDITIKHDIKYQDDPRGSDRTWGGVDNLEAENILGIFSGGDVRIGCMSGSGSSCVSPKDIEIHASILAANKDSGMFSVDDYTSRPVNGSVNLLGGVIQNHYGPHGTFTADGRGTGYGRNYSYDRRFKSSSPPFFPTTNEEPKIGIPTLERLDWKEIRSKDLAS